MGLSSGVKRIEEDGLRSGQQCATAHTLHKTPDDELNKIRGLCTHITGNGEDHHADEIIILPAEIFSEETCHRNDDHVGDGIGSDHPADILDVHTQAASHFAEAHIHDTGIDQFHHGCRYRGEHYYKPGKSFWTGHVILLDRSGHSIASCCFCMQERMLMAGICD